MRRIEKSETDRDKRVQQRFEELENEIRDIFGWSSLLGTRFIRRMIVEFVVGKLGGMEAETNGRISQCIDPYAILSGAEDRSIAEFRDRAYHAVASQYFKDYLQDKDEPKLVRFIAEVFSSWVNGCFDNSGRMLTADEAPENPLLVATLPDREELLGLIVEALPLEDMHGWSEPALASVRARCMLIEACSWLGLWDRCLSVGESLEHIIWVGSVEASPAMAVHMMDLRRKVSVDLAYAGIFETAIHHAEIVLKNDRRAFELFGPSNSVTVRMPSPSVDDRATFERSVSNMDYRNFRIS